MESVAGAVAFEAIHSAEDLLRMLDALLRDEGEWWDRFYADRSRPVPFFTEAPNEDLVEWVERGLIGPGRALELGCGNGRNAVYLARRGFEVDAVDLSPEVIAWARELVAAHGVSVNLACASVFELPVEPGAYDFVYDSGCLHHVPPHRRLQYTALVERALRPGGHLGLVCMRGGCEYGGAEITDWEVYRSRSMQGGLAYPEERLRPLFEPAFELVDLRQMKDLEGRADLFGRPFLNVALYRKR